MKVQYRILIALAAIIAGVLLFRSLIGGSVVALFMPGGTIAAQQIKLIETEVVIMLLVVVPMFILLFTFAWRYREGNSEAKYDPDRSHGFSKQIWLWAIPIAAIIPLSILVWKSAHALDPYQSIQSSAPPVTIEVVALTWKWLFIYPAENIATVNYIQFPEQTPVHFELTADAPMSSFWIPQLGSQIYAMAAMVTQLNLIASSTGEYTGKDTEINGEGYAGMHFVAKSSSKADFDAWVASVKNSTSTLTLDVYNKLTEPSVDNPPAYYSSVDPGLYNYIVMKFMVPTSSMEASGTETNILQEIPAMQGMPGMNM